MEPSPPVIVGIGRKVPGGCQAYQQLLVLLARPHSGREVELVW